MRTIVMIDKTDVINVARSLGKTVTYKQAELIVNEYPGWQAIDPTANWSSIVEDIIYYVLANEMGENLNIE